MRKSFQDAFHILARGHGQALDVVAEVLVTDRCIVLSPAFLKELFCLRFGQVPTQNKFTHGEVAAPIRINEFEQDLKFTLADRNGVAAEESFQHLQRTEHITPRDDAFDVRRVQGGKAQTKKGS